MWRKRSTSCVPTSGWARSPRLPPEGGEFRRRDRGAPRTAACAMERGTMIAVCRSKFALAPRLGLLPVLLLAAGCTDSATLKPLPVIPWVPCPAGFRGECGTVAVPLDWSKPAGETISIFVSRRRALQQPASAQLWLLAGGPGVSGDSLEGIVDELETALPSFEAYVLEHRGVGESTRLGCLDPEAPASKGGTVLLNSELPGCLAAVKSTWGGKLGYFTTTADALDLHHLIEVSRDPGQRVFVYGSSYGTTRALRYLEVVPQGADGVVLDSLVAPGVQFLSRYDAQFDQVLSKVSRRCSADATCGEKMGSDPFAKLGKLRDKLRDGHCPALGMGTATYQAFAAEIILYRELRAHIFPISYRMDRCADADVEAIRHYATTLAGAVSTAPASANRASEVLKLNVMLSELWETPAPSLAELRRRCDVAVACPGLVNEVAPIYASWPRYPVDEWVGKWPETSVPILALNGTLDAQSPYEEARTVALALHGPHQSFVTLEGAAHGAAFGSPVNAPGSKPCGETMMLGFLADPTAPIDTTCLADLAPVTFTQDPAVAELLFGVPDLWENP